MDNLSLNTAPVSEQPNKPGPHYEALLQLLRTSESIWNASRNFFARWDLSPSQFNVLNVLRDHPEGIAQVELSRVLIMHRSNVTGLVDRLEQRKLVARRDSPADRRAYRVVLTAAGRKLLEEILPAYYAAAETVWKDFSVKNTGAFVDDLARLEKNVTAFSETL
jgi:DNA-binding MarR family transcriptional regulator